MGGDQTGLVCQRTDILQYLFLRFQIQGGGSFVQQENGSVGQNGSGNGKTLILPRCAAEHAIDLCVVRSMDDLEAGAYGILEPKKNCALVTAADIDFAVVPCLSFDRKGRRLGQGGGYYDRLLPQLRCPTALICREQLMSPEVPVEEHDMRCTMLITENTMPTAAVLCVLRRLTK